MPTYGVRNNKEPPPSRLRTLDRGSKKRSRRRQAGRVWMQTRGAWCNLWHGRGFVRHTDVIAVAEVGREGNVSGEVGVGDCREGRGVACPVSGFVLASPPPLPLGFGGVGSDGM